MKRTLLTIFVAAIVLTIVVWGYSLLRGPSLSGVTTSFSFEDLVIGTERGHFLERQYSCQR